jgi:hypothetical protein
MEMEGGFFLRKKPLSSMASVYTNSENALIAQCTENAVLDKSDMVSENARVRHITRKWTQSMPQKLRQPAGGHSESAD